MSLTRTTTSDVLLQVAPTTLPFPLAVSTASKAKLGDIDLFFTKPPAQPEVKCRWITVTVPVGTAHDDLTSNPGIQTEYETSTGSWAIDTLEADDHTTFTCTKSGRGDKWFSFEDESYFTLTLQRISVSRTPGEVAFTVTAQVTTDDDPDFDNDDDWTEQDIAMPNVTKSLDDFFFFRSFSCEKPQVTNTTGDAGTVILRWEGSENDTAYYLSGGPFDEELVTGQSHPVSGLTDTTTFVLDARTTGPDGEPVHHYLSTTVTVKDADIRAKTLTASNSITVPATFTADSTDHSVTAFGPTTFEGDVMARNTLTVGGKLDAKAGVDVSGGKLDAKAGLDVSGGKLDAKAGLDVSGGKLDAKAGLDVSAGKLDAKAGLDVSGGKLNAKAGLEVSGAKLDAKAGLGVSGALDVTGANVKALGTMTTIQSSTTAVSTYSKTGQPTTDGFLLVRLASNTYANLNPSTDERLYRFTVATVTVGSMTANVSCPGISIRNFYGAWSTPIPVKANQTYKVEITSAGQEYEPQISIYWLPLGVAA